MFLLQELQKFCRHMVAGFFEAADKNPLIFVELLFWKTSQDVYELTEGYGALERERFLEISAQSSLCFFSKNVAGGKDTLTIARVCSATVKLLYV